MGRAFVLPGKRATTCDPPRKDAARHPREGNAMPPLRHLVLAIALATLASLVAALPAGAAPAERRIALVIGNGAYPGGALATAANDAGLVAQTLQAAGFDVVGARDLDEESLRRTLRDFTDKAAASGPDTVAFLYLSGSGLQLANEAYFAPVDARIETASDVPVRALRISDYVSRLAALPLRARFVVLDAARASPFHLKGDPLAGGLPLMEAGPGSLIATNAAPGTVGPAETGPYGAYALALVEMIREGGLAPAALFERVRLRVAETTRGAEVPWSASRIEAPFVFLEREAGAPSLAGFEPPRKPLGEIGAREAYAACLARDTLPAYEEFAAAYPRDPLAKRVRAIIAARREALTWRTSAMADTPEAYWSYLGRYPRGPHAWDARRRLSALAAALAPPPDYRALAYDVPPPPPDEIVYVERPALVLDDPVYALPPPPVVFLPPRPVVLVDLAPPPPPPVAYLLPVPAYVPVPTYVVAPPAVVAPPNPGLFHNLHAPVAAGPEFHGAPPGGTGLAPVAGAAVGAAIGAAAARVALPPALARKMDAPLGAPGQIPRRDNPSPGPIPGTPTAPLAGPLGGPAALRPSLPGQIAPAAGPRPGAPNPAQALPGAGGTPLPAVAGRPGLPNAPADGRAGLNQIPPAAGRAGAQAGARPPVNHPGTTPPPGNAAGAPQGPAAGVLQGPAAGLAQGVRPPLTPLRPVQPLRSAQPQRMPPGARPTVPPQAGLPPSMPPRLAQPQPRMAPQRMAQPPRAAGREPQADDALRRMRMDQAIRQQAQQAQAQAQARQRGEAQQMMQRQQQQMQDAMRRQQAQAMRQPQMAAPRPQPMAPRPMPQMPRPTPHGPGPGHGCGHPGGPPCR